MVGLQAYEADTDAVGACLHSHQAGGWLKRCWKLLALTRNHDR